MFLDSNDHKALWNAINWKGELSKKSPESPSNEEFREHLEELCNPENTDFVDFTDIHTDVDIPLLDRPIDAMEVENVLRRDIKPKKGCGPDRLPPGLLSLLPVSWIVSLAALFNMVFCDRFPHSWAYAKLVMLFKKGRANLCDNYRGISMLNCLAKVYDYVLYRRLILWFTPSREQAGAQQGRGCIEHIISLRLLMDYCVSKKCKLYIVYIDFSKAYDRIPRDKLVVTLKRLGCGAVMLSALMSMYRVSYSLLGATIVTAVIGVRQGSPTSCFLFTCFVDDMIRMVKNCCGVDGFLQWLHLLMLMDDTVLLATSRELCIKKLLTVIEFCSISGMQINQAKTKFMVVNASDDDEHPLEMVYNDQTYQINWCDSYVYLGSVFTCDGKIRSAIKLHAQDKYKHYLKFVSFVNKNPDFPFIVKHKVLSSALLAALFYGCESWLVTNTSDMNKLYISAIKVLLGVRQTTPNDICLLELGYPPLKAWIKQRQVNFFKTVLEKREGFVDDPLIFVISLCKAARTSPARYIADLLESDSYYDGGVEQLQQAVLTSTKSKLQAYVSMNPELSVNNVYRQIKPYVSEHHRVQFTRLRLVSHNLRIETGRWARLPRDERLCVCGQVQTERHVLESCDLTKTIRDNNRHMTFAVPDIFKEQDACRIVSEILNTIYQS